MSHPLRIWLAEQDVSAFVVRDDLPEWLETSVKGAGWFDWWVKSFEFRLHESCPVVPAWGQTVRVALSGVTRFTGVVDEVDEYDGPVPKITCQPPAVTLKDVMAGTPGADPTTNEERYLFEIPRPGLLIADAVASVLSRFEQNKDPRLSSVDDWTVDVQGSDVDPVGVRSPHGLTGPVFGSAQADTFYADRQWTPYFYEYPGWARIQLDNPLPTGKVRVLRRLSDGLVCVAEWIPRLYRLQAHLWTVLPDQAWRIAPLSAGGEAQDNTAPFLGVDSQLMGHVSAEYVPDGWEQVGAESGYISQPTATSYTRALLGINPDEILACHASFDTPEGSWTVVRRDVVVTDDRYETRFYVTWWGNPLVQRVAGRWKNTSMIDLIKMIALVSGRWLCIAGNVVTLAPRETGTGEVLLPDSGQAIEVTRKRGYSSPSGQVQVGVVDWNNRDSHGLDYSQGRVAALQYMYIDRFAGEHTESAFTFPVSLFPAGLQLLSEPTEGIVTDLDFSTDGRLFRLKTVQEGL